MAQERKALDATAYGVTLALTLLWGVQHVVIKATVPDVSPVTQAAIRTILATFLLMTWARWQGIALFRRDGTLGPGLLSGTFFAVEFVLIYAGLGHTNASRMSVFIYLTPPLTALGLHLFVPSERLGARQWAGIALAFAGLALAFADGFATDRGTWIGDLCGLAAAVFWAGITVTIRATRLGGATGTKALFYQLAVSSVILPLAALALGEAGVVALTPLAIASLAYQTVIVGFASLLAWYWLLTRYYAARLSVMTFLTPMIGVIGGAAFLGEPVSGAFGAAALLVGAGIILVNWRA
jgi:drug/metabolite transporter (DMT)-like permease